MEKNKTATDITQSSADHSWWKRFGWLIVIWSISVISLGIVAYAIKKFMNAAGMSS
jgi:hypothetical protein